MTKTIPPRPESVPDDARYEPEFAGYEWVQGELDAEGRRHGPCLEWNEEGLLHGKCTYVHGKLHGLNENYHPDGKLASAGQWREGVAYDCDYFENGCDQSQVLHCASAGLHCASAG